MRLSRFIILAGAGFLGIGSLYAAQLALSRTAPPPRQQAVAIDASRIGGPFELVDDRGRTVTQADLTGRPTVLFFGFTWCPEICPTTLFELTDLMAGLGADADGVNFVMVTADPERDSPEILHEYLSAFGNRWRGYTGTPEQIGRMAEAYDVRIERVGEGPDYTVNHTASVFLMDASNNLAGTITPHEDRDTALGKLRRLVAA